MRLDADFGGYLLGAPTGAAAIPELKQSQLDILYAYFGGRNVGGRLDFELGRQIHFDLVNFYAFDGADLLLHLSRLFAVEALAGTEVRGDLPLSSPIYELDGTSAGSRDPATRPDQIRCWRPWRVPRSPSEHRAARPRRAWRFARSGRTRPTGSQASRRAA